MTDSRVGEVAVDGPVGTLAVKRSTGAEEENPFALARAASKIRIEATTPGASGLGWDVLGPMKPLVAERFFGGRWKFRSGHRGVGRNNSHRWAWGKRLIRANRS